MYKKLVIERFDNFSQNYLIFFKDILLEILKTFISHLFLGYSIKA